MSDLHTDQLHKRSRLSADSIVVLHATRSAAFCHWYGFSRRLGGLLAILHRSDQPLSNKRLAELTMTTPFAITEQIKHLRRAMEVEAIDTINGGYQLTEIGIAECDEAMRLMREGLVA